MQALWMRDETGLLVFEITADRFLRNMVRAVVGTLLDVGRGKISVRDFCTVIEQKDRTKAGMSVPAHALFLERIVYPDNIWENLS
jgi:tRNA pseudouridine38-40 synthase